MGMISHPAKLSDANIREINNLHNVKSKTELNINQIESINKLHTLGLIFGSGLVMAHTTDFMQLQLSKDRKSRSELVEAIKSRITDIVNKAKVNLLG